MAPIICIVGRSQTGKTTLIEKLIPVLKGRGYRIGTIKHSHHIFDFDKTGKDSWRHKDAGAETVIIASPGKIAMIKNDHEGTLDSLQNFFADLDLVITEGYKGEQKPKIEVVRAARHKEVLLADDAQSDRRCHRCRNGNGRPGLRSGGHRSTGRVYRKELLALNPLVFSYLVV